MATETQAIRENYELGALAGEARKQQRIIKLLESGKHVAQFEFENRVFKSAWKQKCRCGYYGVFNEHLIALIKGEN